MDLPALTRLAGPAPAATQRARVDRRQALGLLLAMAILLGGRGLRRHLLIGPDGRWREHLWLDAVVAADEAPAAEPARPVLTSPLPINSCSVDSLTLLPGVGPVLAGRLEENRRNGVIFRQADDLRQVKGIGPKLAARLDPLVDWGDTTSARPDTAALAEPDDG